MFGRFRAWGRVVRARLAERRDLAFEIAALRQQLAMYERRDRSRNGTFHHSDPTRSIPWQDSHHDSPRIGQRLGNDQCLIGAGRLIQFRFVP